MSDKTKAEWVEWCLGAQRSALDETIHDVTTALECIEQDTIVKCLIALDIVWDRVPIENWGGWHYAQLQLMRADCRNALCELQVAAHEDCKCTQCEKDG